MNSTEHLAWCKERALEYVDSGDYPGAVASMLSNLGKHEATKYLLGHAGILGVHVLTGSPNTVPSIDIRTRNFITGLVHRSFEGDTKFSFDNKDPMTCESAAAVVAGLLQRGYALIVQVGKRKRKPIYQRAKEFDPKHRQYIIVSGPDGVDIGAAKFLVVQPND